jgi:hypothetical protein
MAMKRWSALAMTAFALLGLSGAPALGSGDMGPAITLIDVHGGSDAERAALYRGQMGVLHTDASDGLLYLQWRLLNGLRVGEPAGAALNRPCCDLPTRGGEDDGVAGWAKTTLLVPDVAHPDSWISTELPGPDYTSIPNCFQDAFDSASATLRDRVQRYGARDSGVAAWLLTQNAVFEACSNPQAVLPAMPEDAPAWLRYDRAYQEAAFALYRRDTAGAAARFQAIAADRGSPWQPRGRYLAARALFRAALATRSPEAIAAARKAIQPLEDDAGAYGHGEATRMLHALAYRDQPEALFRTLDGELHAQTPAPDLDRSLKDYLALSAKIDPNADIADWMATLRANEPAPAFAHAAERWGATHKLYWLVAALTLVQPGDAQAPALAEAAAGVPRTSPAWLGAQYHRLRIGFAREDAAALRNRVDAVLATDLSGSDRNLFLAVRAQLATSLVDLMRHALRQPFCSEVVENCLAEEWVRADDMLAFGAGGTAVVMGPETRAILDRLPLRTRMLASAGLPDGFQLDLALTNYGRAVQLQDDAAIDSLAGELATRLPAIRADWLAIRRTPPGAAKRFAEFLVLAKVPGIATDFPAYTRPQGTLHDWQGSWPDWMIVPAASATAIAPPRTIDYNQWTWDTEPGDGADLSCLNQCGGGPFPFRLPDFARQLQPAAAAERNRFFVYRKDDDKTVAPPGSVSVWNEMLAYAQAHPRDPRSPEALYWLVRISHWGQSHDRVGYRAFRLLHTRYPGAAWTRKTPYYYD